jgi:hypothetical protein
MILGVIFKDGKEIDRGIQTGGKKWVEQYPEQSITICNSSSAYSIDDEREYIHDGNITFQELQDNGNGWEVVYDSNEKIDRTVEYDLPNWFVNGGDIPHYEHRITDDGDIEKEFKGYIR